MLRLTLWQPSRLVSRGVRRCRAVSSDAGDRSAVSSVAARMPAVATPTAMAAGVASTGMDRRTMTADDVTSGNWCNARAVADRDQLSGMSGTCGDHPTMSQDRPVE